MERNDVKIIKKKNFHSGKFFFLFWMFCRQIKVLHYVVLHMFLFYGIYVVSILL